MGEKLEKESGRSISTMKDNPRKTRQKDCLVTSINDPWPRPYFIEGGLRKVAPYHYTYNTYCKQRWRDRELLDIFASEFRDRPLCYYEDGIRNGAIVVNGQPATSPHYVVRNGDIISHTLHRHEPPVSSSPIGIVYEDEDIMVIDKPSSLPVHPAGRYNFNSVVEILRAERDIQWKPLPCNRLDRLTSGIMFIGKTPQAAEKLSNQLRERTVRKEYIARVIGEFPREDTICEQPIMQISPKLGLNRARASGKSAKTLFKRLAYYPENSDMGEVTHQGLISSTVPTEITPTGMEWKSKRGYSIVSCLPLTGRTHQIRVHLQFLGHPITNDPIYCNQRVFGYDLAAGDNHSDEDEDIIARLSKMGKEEVAEAIAYHDEMVEGYNQRKAEKLSGQTCEICSTPLYTDPGPHELGIYLHAKRYACLEGNWQYETQMPVWSTPPPPAADIPHLPPRHCTHS